MYKITGKLKYLKSAGFTSAVLLVAFVVLISVKMERVVENTKDSVTCAICTDIFDDARLLSCSHSFCLHCLTEYRADRNDNVKECPICRDLTVPPIGLLYTLPSNEFANKVVEVIRKHDRPEPTAPPIGLFNKISSNSIICQQSRAFP